VSGTRIKRVVLHVDRLSLQGIGPAQRSSLVEALRTTLAHELSSALAEPAAVGALMGRAAYQERLAAGRATVSGSDSAAAAGARVGRQIAGSLTR
jgi:hypothetical protein